MKASFVSFLLPSSPPMTRICVELSGQTTGLSLLVKFRGVLQPESNCQACSLCSSQESNNCSLSIDLRYLSWFVVPQNTYKKPSRQQLPLLSLACFRLGNVSQKLCSKSKRRQLSKRNPPRLHPPTRNACFSPEEQRLGLILF